LASTSTMLHNRISTQPILLTAIAAFISIQLIVLATIAGFTVSLESVSSHSSCSGMDGGNCASSPTSSTSSPPNISNFGYGLFSHVSDVTNEPNILLSPFSIASALALLLAGATPNSSCANQIRSALSISSHSEIPALSKNILQTNSDGPVQLTSANGLWIAKSILKSYIESAQSVHDARVSPLPDVFDPIDEYITAKTNGMIKNMLEGSIDPLMRAVLVNAVYFKGAWMKKFELDKTREGTFTNSAGEPRKAMFMDDTRTLRIAVDVKELGGASIISVDYGKETNDDASLPGGNDSNSDFSALFFLPSENNSDSLSTIFSSLAALCDDKMSGTTSISLKDFFEEKLYSDRVRLRLPRFKISYGTKSLKPHLQSIGIRAAFDGNEAFLGMSDDPQLYISDVLHKAVMEVTEEGTVASAASAVLIKTKSIPKPPIEMTFDRPFGMIVVHTPSLTPLFVAKVDDPEFI